ncbi:hypothetical protein SNEBB_004232 [Seison nebaliae]|nr:hypothetical protein SNEBB_004232 [Seison nebaliae]
MVEVRVQWIEDAKDEENNRLPVVDCDINPENTQLICAAGKHVLVYTIINGVIEKTLKGHSDRINCVAYCKDGTKFASGGRDRTVIIWKKDLTPLIKYSHADSVQCMSFNPITNVLCSCSPIDFNLWREGDESIHKTKMKDRITAVDWSSCGKYLAFGYFSGLLSLREGDGVERFRVIVSQSADKRESNPIWCVSFCPKRNEDILLAVGVWDRRLLFYRVDGKQIGKDRILDYDPCFVRWFPDSEFLLCGGSGRVCNIHTREGVKLAEVAKLSGWIWNSRVIKINDEQYHVVVVSQDGSISLVHLLMTVVHSIYRDRYAYREMLTEVIVQHLLTDEKVRIKCRDLVKNVAVYQNNLAIVLSAKVVIYRSEEKKADNMQYKLLNKIHKKIDCVAVFILSSYLILCKERKIESIDFDGNKINEWTLDSKTTFVKIIGGPPGSEGMLVGQRNGQVTQIFVDNSLPMDVVKINNYILSLDLSMQRKKLAIVDKTNRLYVYNKVKKELLYEEPKARSVVFNQRFEDLIAYSYENKINVKMYNQEPRAELCRGNVVGYIGSYIYCLHNFTITTTEMANTEGIFLNLNDKKFNQAYDIACMGASKNDWKEVGMQALKGKNYMVATKAFHHTGDYKLMSLISSINDRKRRGETVNDVFLGDAFAYQNEYDEAAKIYRRANRDDLAMQMYSDLRMFDKAKDYITGGDQEKHALLMKQAEWALNNEEYLVAADLYVAAKEWNRAIDIAIQQNRIELIMEIVSKLDKAETTALYKCAEYLRLNNENIYAAEVYIKLDDIEQLVLLRIEGKQWNEAFAIAEQNPEYKSLVLFNYGKFLAEQGKFEEAQDAFQEAGRRIEAIKVLTSLIDNAVAEFRFSDASYHYWVLSTEYTDIAREKFLKGKRKTEELVLHETMTHGNHGGDASRTRFNRMLMFQPDTDYMNMDDENSDHEKFKMNDLLSEFRRCQHYANMYYAYQHIHDYLEGHNPALDVPTLFNAGRFIFHSLLLQDDTPMGISRFKVLYVLSIVADTLEVNKFGKFVCDEMKNCVVPRNRQMDVSNYILSNTTKQFNDPEELEPFCYRCSQNNPLFNKNSNRCSNCQQPFILSIASFKNLPVVEFYLEKSLDDREAKKLATKVPGSVLSETKLKVKKNIIGDGNQSNDSFIKNMKTKKGKIEVNEEILQESEPETIFISDWKKPGKWQWYKLIKPSELVTMCPSCYRFFDSSEWETLYIKNDRCPFCRRNAKNIGKKGTLSKDKFVRHFAAELNQNDMGIINVHPTVEHIDGDRETVYGEPELSQSVPMAQRKSEGMNGVGKVDKENVPEPIETENPSDEIIEQ